MSQCPFHTDSVGISQEGEIEAIQCSACGEYRISRMALRDLEQRETPRDWLKMIASRALISTRDVRALA